MQAEALEQLTLEVIQGARRRIAPHVRVTPLWPSAALSARLGVEAYVKLELFQKTGSFKVRGAFNKMLPLAAGSRVVAVSGGNHAQAVAHAAGVLGMQARILMPAATPANYVEATRGYGAEVVLVATIAEAFQQAQAAVAAGWVMVHPFDDLEVIAGQATLGLEILAELPEVTDIVVSIGGGGLATGVAAAVKPQRPRLRMWGVETEGADAMARAVAAGRPVRLEAITSIARTLGAPEVSGLTLAAIQRWFERVEVVSDAATVAALDWLLERLKVLTEPAAACTLAAAERLAPQWGPTSRVVLVLCGGNLAVETLCGFTPLRGDQSTR